MFRLMFKRKTTANKNYISIAVPELTTSRIVRNSGGAARQTIEQCEFSVAKTVHSQQLHIVPSVNGNIKKEALMIIPNPL